MRSFDSYPDQLWALRYGFSASKLWGFASLTLILAVALVPAVNVVVVKSLSQALADSGPALILLMAAGLLFGAGSSLVQVSYAVSRINGLRINLYATDQFDRTLAHVPPKMYESEEFMSIVRKARQCVSDGHPSSQFQASLNIVSALLTAGSLGYTIYGMSARAALVSILAPIPTMIAYGWYGKQESKYWPESAEAHRRSVYLQDQFAYQRTGSELSTMRATVRLVTGAEASRRVYRSIREKLEGRSVIADTLSGLATTILFILALMFLYQDTGSDAGAIFAGIVGLMSGISAMAGVGYQIGELAISLPANRHFRELLKRDMPRVDARTIVGAISLCARGLEVRYGDVTAVKGVSLTAAKGTLCALVGENGSGKTSVIKALQGLQSDACGRVSIDGEEYDVGSPDDWFMFACVQQDYGRYELTVREFVTLGVSDSRVSDSAITEALAFAEADSFVRELPQGVDSPLGVQWGGTDLSGGQWQRLAIARAVLTDAPVWFLDEPTSSIDAPTEQRIFDRLAEQARRRIIILSSHRVSTLRAAGNIVVLKAGEVCEQGSYSDLMREGTEFYRMFRTQLDKD